MCFLYIISNRHLLFSSLTTVTAHFMHKGNKDDSQPTTPGVIALGVFLVLMLIAAVGGIIWSFRENLPQWIK